MSDFGIYKGQDFLWMELTKREWLIESILREKDSVLLVGNEKSGKSLLILQLICSLTSQHPFIDKWEVKRPCRVSYVQLEGELADTQDRFKRMMKTIEINPDLFQMLFLPPQELHTRPGMFGLCDQLELNNPVDVVIIDPLYFAFSGSLSDDEKVRAFIGNLRVLKDRLACAIILVHHTHKVRWTAHGDIIAEGDEATFGSKFLKAYPDHTILFSYNKNRQIRTLSCDTQRSGDIIKQCNLKLIEPDPLYFEEDEKYPTLDHLIINLLDMPEHKEQGLTPDEIMDKLKLNRATFYKSMKKIYDKIKRINGRPVRYRAKNQTITE